MNQIATGFLDQIANIPHTSFVTDLAFIMIIGAIVTLAFFKIKQPLIIGYLFAGMLLGPLSPLWSWILPIGSRPSDMLEGVGILTDMSALNLFSEIGVILLLFVIGIEFPYAKIKSIGRMAIGIGNQIANATGAKVLKLPTQVYGIENISSYIEMMDYIINQMTANG